ncbi:MAG: SusC/RagA family TonB-linked outer membrane protein [Alistipes sp.]|nr:SusC/RagA family TonB-linked outer membrane protein [Alistipes sp.]
MNVTLNENIKAIDDVVVIAFGQTTKEAFTGSAGTVKSEELEKRQVSNVTNALAGAVAGVQTFNSNGQPGMGSSVRIRGFGSLNAGSTPLYVVDGIPYDGDISAINSADIESMTVLKDAASTSLYGARAANGVIMITTKRGKAGEAKISVDTKWGVNTRMMKNYNVLKDPRQYYEQVYRSLYNGEFYNTSNPASAAEAHAYANANLFSVVGGYRIFSLADGQDFVGINGRFNPNATLGYLHSNSKGGFYLTPDDWEDATYQNNLRQEYNVAISGAIDRDRLNYYASFGYLSDGGLIDNSDFSRFSTRLSVDYQAKKWLKVGANLSYAYTAYNAPSEQTTSNSSGNAFMMANKIAPIYPLYVRDASGKVMVDSHGLTVYDFGDGDVNGLQRNFMSLSNPLGTLYLDKEQSLADVFNGKWYAKVTILDGLDITGNWGLAIDNTRAYMLANPYYGQPAASGGYVDNSVAHYFNFNHQYLINYAKTFNEKHNLNLMAGYDGYMLQAESVEAIGYNLYNPDVPYVNNTIDERRGYGARPTDYFTQGFIVRADYNYDQKYYGSVSFRRDGSSRFAPNHRWGNFWSASAAWILSRESFMENVRWIDILKLKASFGQLGNDQIGNYYAYLDQYAMSGADGVFSDGVLGYKGNPDLTWESSNSFNVGAEFSFWKGRLSGSVEYFLRQTSDMLYYKPVAPSNGYSSYPMNVGSIRNSGVEVDLNGDVLRLKNFRWNINANLTYINNKIVKLHPDLNGRWISGASLYEEGKSMYTLFLPRYAGVDGETGEALYWTSVDGNGKPYLDENGNPYSVKTASYSLAQTNASRGEYNVMPKVYGGFGTSMEFYGVDFSISFAYQLGGRALDYTYMDFMHGGSEYDMGTNWHADILKAWKNQETSSVRNADGTWTSLTDIPRLNYEDAYTNSTSDRFLVSSDFLSINNITLGYTLPQKWTSKIGLSKLRIYFAADNVALFSARQGFDPRQGVAASESGTIYSPIRTFSGGLNLTF